jgi:hypothetical protein
MALRCRAIGVFVVVALAFSAGVFAQAPKDRKLADALKRETQAVGKVLDGVAAGQPAPNDLSLVWVREDFLKAQNKNEYVPFMVTIDASMVTTPNAVIYWRVVPQASAPAASAAAVQKKDRKTDKPAYEDVGYAPVVAGQSQMRLSRSFTVPAGTYDVYVVVKEAAPERATKGAPAAKMSVLKRTVTVPDFWNDELITSSVLMLERFDTLPAPLTPEQQTEHPYAFGAMELVPKVDAKLTKKNDLSIFMMIYNAKGDAKNMPDVAVEYNFYGKAAGGEKFFTKTVPLSLNAQTLPPGFDAATHQLTAGQAVPLSTFPEGDYRLEMKITDKVANKSVTRDVMFSVAGS